MDFLNHSGAPWDCRFLALYHSDNASDLSSCQESIVGKAMEGWWDKCSEAGPKSRQASSFNQQLPNLDCLSVIDGEIKTL